jgi:hypothetical protein
MRQFKIGKIPDSLPLSPNSVYSKEGWKNWGDWLGTNYVANQTRSYLPFSKAKVVVQKLGAKSVAQWNALFKLGKQPPNVPRNSDQVYRDKGWKGWADFLGKTK